MKIINKKANNIKAVLVIFVAFILFLVFSFYYKSKSNSLIQASPDKITSNSSSENNIPKSFDSKNNPENQLNAPANEGIPLKPSGTFVSNHKPNLSGSPAPNSMSSTCKTTPGAYCEIRFVNLNTTRSLPKKIADSSGNVYWSWTLQEINLYQGEWSIYAVANIGSNSVQENDSLNLDVGQ